MLFIFHLCVFLGFNRNLPGFPRYEIKGREDQGEYDLQITNVSIEDDDEFQCQVGPGAAGEPPLLGIAVLTVLSKQYRTDSTRSLICGFRFCFVIFCESEL